MLGFSDSRKNVDFLLPGMPESRKIVRRSHWKFRKQKKESSKVDTKQARAALLPPLSASITQNLSNYPFPTNNSSSSHSTTGNYGINASWQIFDGGARTNNIKLSIIQNYLQIFYADEAVKTCENAVELSAEQYACALTVWSAKIIVCYSGAERKINLKITSPETFNVKYYLFNKLRLFKHPLFFYFCVR